MALASITVFGFGLALVRQVAIFGFGLALVRQETILALDLLLSDIFCLQMSLQDFIGSL